MLIKSIKKIHNCIKKNAIINYINSRNYLSNTVTNESDLLFFTYVNEKYYEFAVIYPFFAILNNPNAKVEIVCENLSKFKKTYNHIISFYKNNNFFQDKVLYRQVDNILINIKPGTIRFIENPQTKTKYVYIADVDIIILDEVLEPHLLNIKNNNLDFSNIKRPGLNKLSGLHFIEYDKMYPIKITDSINLYNINDEEFLFKLMKMHNLKIPDENILYRPTMGIHISYYSRPPLNTLTTNDKATKVVNWGPFTKAYIAKYMQIKQSDIGKEFFACINEKDIKLRRIIQIIEMTMFYITAHT